MSEPDTTINSAGYVSWQVMDDRNLRFQLLQEVMRTTPGTDNNVSAHTLELVDKFNTLWDVITRVQDIK